MDKEGLKDDNFFHFAHSEKHAVTIFPPNPDNARVIVHSQGGVESARF